MKIFVKMSFVILVLICNSACSTAGGVNGSCTSPDDFIRMVYSKGNDVVEYKLDPNIQYKNIQVVFFAKKGLTKRNNSYLTLKDTEGTFKLPETALIAPQQRWFNFTITDVNGCLKWGLVNEVPLQRNGNKIIFENPSGEGDAFVLPAY